MFRFFRNIRQQFLLRRQGYAGHVAENKTVRYLKYAVGEILLIVVGILIALQINNWNEERKLEKQRLELIENLKADFRTNLKVLDETIFDFENKREEILHLLQVAVGENKDFSVLELKSMAGKTFRGGYRFQPAIGSYRSAVSTGSMGLIKDSSLNELFIEFEDANMRFQTLADINRKDRLIGKTSELRTKLGSFYVLLDSQYQYFTPRLFSLSEEQYRETIAQKDVYSVFETKYELLERGSYVLLELKKITEQILTALD